jgi:hypothetical protein
MAKDVEIYYGSCQDILAEDLRIRHVSPKFYSTTADRSRRKIMIYLNMQKWNVLKNIIIGDKLWLYS